MNKYILCLREYNRQSNSGKTSVVGRVEPVPKNPVYKRPFERETLSLLAQSFFSAGYTAFNIENVITIDDIRECPDYLDIPLEREQLNEFYRELLKLNGRRNAKKEKKGGVVRIKHASRKRFKLREL